MKRERLKTAALVLLVACSIILTVNKWFSEKLWPDGYNFFSNLTNYFSFGEKTVKKSYYLSKENISNPSEIVVTNGDLRGVYTHTSEDYNSMVGTVKDTLKIALSSKEFVLSDAEKWKGALKGVSLYVTYPVAYDTAVFAAVMDTQIAQFGISAMKEFIITPADPITGKNFLYIKDASADKYICATLDFAAQTDELIARYAKSSVGEYAYSFELNFDTKSDTVEQKIVIEPQVILSISPVTKASVTKINYFDGIANNRPLYSKFLRAFGFNTTNIRKYVNVDNSIVFAENYGSITMYPDGLLEYSALDDSKGISLTSSANPSFYDSFIGCIEFVNKVWDTACGDCSMNINLASLTKEENGFKLAIDYYADGMIAVSKADGSTAHEKISHAIEITVKNSKIVSYRQLVNGYVSNGDSIECTGIIEALDMLMAGGGIKSDTITDLYLAYAPSNGDVCVPYWVAKTDRNEVKIIKNK